MRLEVLEANAGSYLLYSFFKPCVGTDVDGFQVTILEKTEGQQVDEGLSVSLVDLRVDAFF